jgi:hypothetical protein
MRQGLLIFISIILFSCNKDESSESIEQLKAKFHGKYEMISSISSVPVDMNMDGISSTNLLNENREILYAGLELRVLDAGSNLFEEKWPTEYISLPKGEIFDSTSYHPSYTINYANYINSAICQFDENYKSIKLLSEFYQNSTNKLIVIESITLEENEIIKVISIRKLYTMNGWTKTRIVSQYKRFTIDT